MGPESFEDKIGKKFQGQSIKVPRGVWNGVEGQLNSEAIQAYQKGQATYKWIAVAAMLLAALSFTFQFLDLEENDIKESEVTQSYNALLDSKVNFSSYYDSRTLMNRVNNGTTYPIFIKSTNNKEDEVLETPYLAEEYLTFEAMDIKKSQMNLARPENHIYPYVQAGFYEREREEKKTRNVWAGLEAGAGNFNSTFDGTNGLAGSINAGNLASAIGSEGFVNPSAIVNPQLDDGVATTIGFDFGFKVGRRFTIESGIAYTNVDSRGSTSINVLDVFSFAGQELSENSNGLEPELPGSGSRVAPLDITEYDYDVDLRNNLQFTSIPVKAGYFIVDRKMSLRVNAGISANYLLSSSLTDPNQGIVSSTQTDLYNDWSFDGIGGLELGYSLFNKFDVTLEPNYRHSITPISDTQSSPSRFIIQTGLRYTLK